MISTVAIRCEDVTDTMAVIVGNDGTLYLHGTREERLSVLRSWAWAESVFLRDEIAEVA